MTNNSIFTRVLALVLCFIMVAGMMTSCFQEAEPNQGVSTTTPEGSVTTTQGTTKPNADTTTTTGDSVNNDPVEDPADPNELYSASAELALDSLIYGALANEVVISANEEVAAFVPADVKVEAGASALSLSIKNVEEDTFADSETLSNLDVHISGIALDNTVPMTVKLGAILPAGLANTELKLYHVENGAPVLMTRVNSVDEFAIHNQYVYDAETGNVTIYVASFSVFTAVQTSADVWDGSSDKTWYNDTDTEFTLTTAEQLAGFRDLVDEGNTFAGKTVKLAVDINLANIPFDPIGFGYWYEKNVVDNVDKNTVFMGTFDGGNHTIYNLYENCWELDPDKTNYGTYTYSTAGAGLFASIKNATIKNLAISGAEIVFECVDMGIVVGYAQGTCHFENIIVTDSKIANYNRYTGGVVGEVSYGPYGIDTTKGYSHTFKNVTVDSSVTVSGLWGSFGCGMGGVIGGKWGDATVKMENVVSAPTMDVYNDVVSAYQWYAFRGCGMLIGHTEEPYSDGRHSGNATASFLTCKNVNVYYGDWTKYNYYEFAGQDSATGRSYPWVRAEEGNYCDAFSNIRYGVPTHTVEGVTTAVSELSPEELEKVATDHVVITFDQLYGADRGMYGTNKHEGVNVSYRSPKTFYIKNNVGWENLTLHYIYEIGEETWTTIPDGVELVEFNGVYRIDLPVGAKSFTITADGGYTSDEFIVDDLTEKETYLLHEHNFSTDNGCKCGAKYSNTEVNFALGVNGSSSHSDGSEKSSYTETINGYTLNITSASKMYTGARDAKGNSAIKLGTGSVVGSLIFTVSENVNKVIIYVAKYKDDTSNIQINGTEYPLTKNSDDGEYDEIIVDTSSNKTVTLTTVSGGLRCMINTITFVVAELECPNHIMQVTDHKDASCGVAGYTTKQCTVCGKTETTTINALEHNYTGTNPYICLNNCGVHNLPAAGSTITIQQALWIAETLANGKETTNKYVITGVIDDKDHPSNTGATTINADGSSIYITNIHNVDGSIGHEDFTVKLKDGDTITVSAKIAKNDKGEAQLHETWLASHTDSDPADHTCDICGAREITNHIDENSDKLCDICGNPIEGGSTEPTPDPDPETPTTTTVSKSHTDIATIAGVTVGQSGSINGKTIKLDDNISIICNKGNSTSNPCIYDESIRLYQNGATLTISAKEGYTIKTINITVADDSAGKGPISVTGGTASALTNLVYTITADEGISQVVITTTGTDKNSRLYVSNIEVEYSSAGSSSEGEETEECKHTNTTTNTVDATCTAAGSTTVTCADCGKTVSTEVIEATGHDYVDGTCSACSEKDPDYKEEPSTPTYVKVTSADQITSGTYVLVVNGYVMTKYDSSGWVLVEKFSGTGDTIVSDSIATWTLTVSGTSVTLKDANGTFIKPKSGNNNGIQTGSYNWAWEFANGTVTFKGTGSDTTTLAANTGSQNKIRAYKTSTVSGNSTSYPSTFTLYKLVEN